MSKEGYLLCVGGPEQYYRLGNRTVNNIRQYDTQRDIAVLTDNIELAKQIIPGASMYIFFNLNNHNHVNIDKNSLWMKYGFCPKVFQAYYSPFEYTCYMDVDMFFLKDFTFIWENKFHLDIPGLADENNKAWDNWQNMNPVMEQVGYNCPGLFSTIIKYDTAILKRMLDADLTYFLDNLKTWNINDGWRAWANSYDDQIIYSLLMGKNLIRPNEFLDKWLLDLENVLVFEKIKLSL